MKLKKLKRPKKQFNSKIKNKNVFNLAKPYIAKNRFGLLKTKLVESGRQK